MKAEIRKPGDLPSPAKPNIRAGLPGFRSCHDQGLGACSAQAMNPTLRTIDGIEALANGIASFGLSD